MEGKEWEHKTKSRLKGLFSKEKGEKKAAPEVDVQDVDDFLRGSSDKLYFHAPAPDRSSQDVDTVAHEPSDNLRITAPTPTASHPPPLTRLDTSSARRWPTAAEVKSARGTSGRSASPKQKKKGLVVRFTNDSPTIIGEGGDEAELPTISLRQRAHTHPSERPSSQDPQFEDQRAMPEPSHVETRPVIRAPAADFHPRPLRRAATGFESISDAQKIAPQEVPSLPQISSPFEAQNGNHLIISHDPTSFAARVQAERRAGEGKALSQAASNPSSALNGSSSPRESPDSTNIDDFPLPGQQKKTLEGTTTRPKQMNAQLTRLELPSYSPINFSNQMEALSLDNNESKLAPPSSPSNVSQLSRGPSNASQMSQTSSIPPQLSPGYPHASQGELLSHSPARNHSPLPVSRSSTLTIHGAALAVGDEAIQEFSNRVAHLFNIFLLSAESLRPLSSCSLGELVQAALYWFLKGRLHLEETVRDRPSSPEAQKNNAIIRQQAYADLAKAYWIIEQVTSQAPELSIQQTDPQMIDVLETRKSICSRLRKLTMSMKRNNFLPSEEASLPQGLDTSIWIQDGGNRSLLASQKQANLPNLNDYFPLGDTNRSFHYGRAFAGAMLIEDVDSQSQEYRAPALISIIRGINETALRAVIATQDGMLKVCVQGDRTSGPTWDQVRWSSKSNIIDIRLPRGFLLRLQCSHQDFRTLRGIIDYQRQVHSGLVPQKDEELVFETFLKTFQYFEPDPASAFPKEALYHCRLRLLERTIIGKASAGTMRMHRGFRLGLVSSPNTKNLRGVNQELPSTQVIQFGFLRGEGGLAALSLRLTREQSSYNVILTFEDVAERMELHARFTGISLRDREAIVMDSGLKSFSVTSLKAQSEGKDLLKSLDFQTIRVINEEQDESFNAKTILSTSLRVVMDFNGGSITDRVNIGPGELKVRLNIKSPNELKVLRLPQQDMTASVVESQAPRELPLELSGMLATIASSETSRTYQFPSVQDLQLFQAALTGFSVLFDGMASSFNISRRRMVVPIYKKWDAATTRLQLVQKDKVVQLVAFFENFSHGECMNFALKSTDNFESSTKHSKFILRIVDAKFAMPKDRGEAASGGDASFVCLDLPDYPGEHDDITIVFDLESDYEKFTKALPAPVKAASRLGSIKR